MQSKVGPPPRPGKVVDCTYHSGVEAKFLDGAALAALLGTSKNGESAVTSLGPSQPYLQKCSVPGIAVPSTLPRFTEGCKYLKKNIVGPFSAVIVMAQDLNSGGASWASFLPRG